ncbi:MAG TPA: cache domain-containing protein, partial [Chthoniobacterales bacterium]
MSLTKKLVLAFLLVPMVPLGVIIGVLHRTFVQHAERQVGTRLEDTVIQVGKGVDAFMADSICGLQDLAEDPEVSSGDRDTADKRLSRYIGSFPAFTELMLVDARGTVIACSSSPEVGTSLFTSFDDTRAEFEQASSHSPGPAYISDLSDIPALLRPGAAEGQLEDITLNVQVLTKVENAAGQTVGVLVGDLVTDALHDLLQDLKRNASDHGSACLLDKNALVLMTTDPEAPLLFP